MKVDKPGLYSMTLPEYIADPAPEPSLSASAAHTLITQTAIHAYMRHPRLNPGAPREESKVADIGTIAHGLLLEGDESRIVLIEADDWRTKDAKEKRDAAYAEQKIPLLGKQLGPIRKMVEVARSAIAHSELASAFAPQAGKAEQTMVWEEKGIWLRSRPDWLTNDRELIIDYKTTGTSAAPLAWMRGPMLGNGCDLQAVLGLRGLRELFNARNPQFVFMVQEQEPPYAVSFVGLSPTFLHMAESKLDRAMQLWGDCTMTNCWPGYPSRICWVDPPVYAAIEEEENSL